MLSRIGDFAFSQRMMTSMTTTQNRMRETNEQIATGKKLDRFADLGADARFLVRSETALAKAEGFLLQNQRVLERVNAMDTAMARVSDLAEQARTLLTQRVNGATGAEMPLEEEMASITAEMTSVLNRRFAGHYLFAGSRSDMQPVDGSALPITDPASTAYYQGDNLTFTARVDVDIQIELDATAADDGFRTVFAALGLAARGHDPANAGYTSNDLTDALDLLNDGVRMVAEHRGALAVDMGRIEATMESQETTALYLTERISGLVDTDLAEAISRLSADRTALEASYASMAQLSGLSLVKFL